MNRNLLLWIVSAAIVVTLFAAPQSRWASQNHVDVISGRMKIGSQPQLSKTNEWEPEGRFVNALSTMPENPDIVAPPEDSLRGWSLVVRLSSVTPLRRNSAREAVLELCLTRGAKADPGNAFWHLNQAALEHARGDRAAMMRALSRAEASKTYDDYARTEYDARVQAIEAEHGYRGNRVRITEAWSIMLPYIASINAVVRDTEATDLELRRQWLRVANQLQSVSTGSQMIGRPRWVSVMIVNKALEIKGDSDKVAHVASQVKLLADPTTPAVTIERVFQESERSRRAMYRDTGFSFEDGLIETMVSTSALLALLLVAGWAYLARLTGASVSLPQAWPLWLACAGALPVGLFAGPFLFAPLGYGLLALALQVNWKHLPAAFLVASGLLAVAVQVIGLSFVSANLLIASLMCGATAILLWKCTGDERRQRGFEMASLVWTVCVILAAATGEEVVILPALIFLLGRHSLGRMNVPDYPAWGRMILLGLLGLVGASVVDQWSMTSVNQLTAVRVLAFGILLWVSWQFLRRDLERPLAVLGVVVACLYAGSVGLEVRQNAVFGRELAAILAE